MSVFCIDWLQWIGHPINNKRLKSSRTPHRSWAFTACVWMTNWSRSTKWGTVDWGWLCLCQSVQLGRWCWMSKCTDDISPSLPRHVPRRTSTGVSAIAEIRWNVEWQKFQTYITNNEILITSQCKQFSLLWHLDCGTVQLFIGTLALLRKKKEEEEKIKRMKEKAAEGADRFMLV